MPIFKQYKCDGCGAAKAEANHWFTLRAGVIGLTIQRLESAERAGLSDDMEILCGQECVSKKVSEWMGARPARSGPRTS